MASKLPDKIIAVSEHTKADLVLHGVSADRVTVVPNAIYFHEIQLLPTGGPASDVIFAGRLIKEKNVDLLISAIHLLSHDVPQIKCFIVGDGPERKRLENLRRELQLDANVEFLGFLQDHSALYSLMKASKVFVLPSEREGFGMVVLEANACGLPVVVTRARHSAATDITRHGESGFICDPDATSIAEAVNKLLADDALRTGMQQSAEAWAGRFDWRVVAGKTIQAYQELLDG
jgi:glycosyltransferase involved in cell wall biosynthesis